MYESMMGMGDTPAAQIFPSTRIASRPAPGVPVVSQTRSRTEEAMRALERNLTVFTPRGWSGANLIFSLILVGGAVVPAALAGYFATRKSGEGKKGAVVGGTVAGITALVGGPLVVLATGSSVSTIMAGRTGGEIDSMMQRMHLISGWTPLVLGLTASAAVGYGAAKLATR